MAKDINFLGFTGTVIIKGQEEHIYYERIKSGKKTETTELESNMRSR